MGSSGNAKKQECKESGHREKKDDISTAHPTQTVKKHKKRTKKLVSQLKEQIEFYFSDSNLQKDRFLKQEIVKDDNGYVKIKTIADFNRMKQLTDDIGLVIKAMKSSQLLKLNEDETMVKRIAPLPEAKNVDAETIYVENLPPQTDHDWLRKIFSQFGKVTYVSIPRFKYTSNIKGFAFIEFENSTEANSAVEAFRKETDEKDNHSDDQKLKRRKRSYSESEVENTKQNSKSERKRRRTTSESSADSQEGNSDSPKKKQRFLVPEQHSKVEEELKDSSDGEKARKRKRNDKTVHWEQEDDECKSQAAVTKGTETIIETNTETPNKKPKVSASDSNTENEEREETVKKKKLKKRKRKLKVKEKKEAKLPHFRVIPKLEWMQLKQEYKKLQRESMQELKKQLQVTASKQGDDDEKQEIPSQTKEPEPTDKKEDKDKSTVRELPFTAGVLLHFKCLSGTDLPKSEIRTRVTVHAPLAYIDITEGTAEGYIRFHTAENCTTVLDNMDSSSGLELNKVTGEQEREYWRKINADRVARYQAKRQKKRGTEKVARKVDAVQVNHQVTHIRFDEE